MNDSLSAEDLHELTAGLAAADVIDALNQRHHHRAHITGLDGPPDNPSIVGRAVTISFLPVRDDLMDPERHSLGPAIYRALEGHDPVGAVLVMASNGHPDTSLGGSTKLSRLRNLDMAGVVCDGRLRDFDELAAYPFSSFCTGEAVRAGGNEIQPYLANIPVAVAGVTVSPGDIIFADSTGVAVVPPAEATAVFEAARAIKEMGNQMLEKIALERADDVLNQGSSEA